MFKKGPPSNTDLIFWLGLLIPTGIIFKAFFLPGPLARGDAPYFVPEYLRTFVDVPYIWTSWGEELGRVSNVLWIHPLMFLMGVLSNLGLESDAIVRILFYFPGVTFSLVSPVLLVRYLGHGKIVQFFTSLLYTINTYFILLVDGGQVGVLLAYGLFPLSLFTLHNLLSKPQISFFYQALIVFTVLGTADMRVAIISLFVALLWRTTEHLTGQRKFEKKTYVSLFLFGLAVFGVNMYWLLPTLMLLPSDAPSGGSTLQLNSLLNSFLLFQPHWYLNQFGRISPPYFYFIGLPLLIFASLWHAQKNKAIYTYTFCFLIVAFLAKGEAPPLGFFYGWTIDHLPLGAAFRDSTKFFIPLTLFGGILLGLNVDRLFSVKWNKRKVFKKVAVGLVYVYLIALVWHAFFGKLNGVLAGHTINPEFQKINNFLKNQPDFMRIAYFPEHDPYTIHTTEKQIVDAKILVNKRPFASLNAGTFDRFNFLHDTQYLDWLDVFNIQYLVLSGNPRKPSLTEEEQYDWDSLKHLLDSTKELQKVDIGTNIGIYQVPHIMPRIFGARKLFVVTGGDDIYTKFKEGGKEFSPKNQPFIFAEDGKWDPKRLTEVKPDSVVLILNNKGEQDFVLSLLQKYFVLPERKNSQWALRSPNEYLEWKYELLKNGIETKEFDYNLGVAFSTNKGERLVFNIDLPSGEYVLAIRSLVKSTKDTLNGTLDEVPIEIRPTTPGKFNWTIRENVNLSDGKHTLTLENAGGAHVVNTTALIPKDEWNNAWNLKKDMMSKIQTLSVEADTWSNPEGIFDFPWTPIAFDFKNPTEYRVEIPKNVNWITFTDSFNAGWQVNKDGKSKAFPFYSTFNGFSVLTEGNATLKFEGQKLVQWGLYFSGGTIILLAGLYTWKRLRK